MAIKFEQKPVTRNITPVTPQPARNKKAVTNVTPAEKQTTASRAAYMREYRKSHKAK